MPTGLLRKTPISPSKIILPPLQYHKVLNFDNYFDSKAGKRRLVLSDLLRWLIYPYQTSLHSEPSTPISLTIAIPFCSKPEKDEIRRVSLGQVSFVKTRKNMKTIRQRAGIVRLLCTEVITLRKTGM